MDLNFPRKPGFLIAVLSLLSGVIGYSPSFAGDVPLYYKTPTGSIAPVTVGTGINSQGYPVVPTYKGKDGAWHSTTVIAQVCGTNADGTPVACNIADQLPSSVLTTAKINVQSGIAGLNDQAQVTAGVNTPSQILTQTGLSEGNQGSIPLNMTSNGWQGDAPSHLAGPRITVGVSMNNMADQMAMFGGHRLYDSVFSKFYALPYGVGDNGGCVHSSVMTYAPGTGANCGAGGWDAVTEYELATNNPPWYIAGADFPDENGTSHSVTFTTSGAIIRPALPASYTDYMHYHMNVMTNIVAGPTLYSGLSLDGVQGHRNQDQQFYGGMLESWKNDSDSTGTFTQFTMTGQWQPISGSAVDSGHVPQVGTQNTASAADRVDALDQTQYAEFTHPFIEFGTYIKHFTRNTSCEVIIKSGTDGEAMKRLGLSRKCDEELDNWYHGPDYGATMHGLTIGAGFDNKVSQDSYGLSVAGLWPEGIRAWLGSDGIDFDGDAYKVGSRIGSAAVVGTKKMIAEYWQEPTANIGYLESVKLWSQTDTLSETNNANTGGAAANGMDVSYWFGPRQSSSSFNVDGTFEAAIAFNPGWAKNGLALCGSNAASFDMTSSGAACLTVDSWGNTSTTGSLAAGNGLTVSSGTTTLKDVVATSYKEALKTPASSSAPCQAGEFTDDENYHYVCVADNSWKRVALSSF